MTKQLTGERACSRTWFEGAVGRVERAHWQDLEVDAHMAFTVKPQREVDASVQSDFSLVQNYSLGDDAARPQWVWPLLLTQSRCFPVDTPRSPSAW